MTGKAAPVELRVDALDVDDVRALKALWEGSATDYQQRLALKVIVNKFSRTHDLLYVPGDAAAGVFLNGRAFVGTQIMRVLKLPVSHLVDEKSNDDPSESRTSGHPRPGSNSST